MSAATETCVSATAGVRSRYIDCLRALALVRVIAYHLLSWAWLPLLFPSMGVMFALAGGLVASSLGRRDQWSVLRSRVRRLLPSLWVMGLLLVPVMVWRGWTYDPVGFVGQPLDWRGLLFWVVPFATPVGSDWGADLVLPLWYLRTYLWLLLLSPALLWLFRRWPVWTLSGPLVVMLAFTSGAVVDNGSRSDELVLSLGTFGACWLLGFAHHDGVLRRLPLRLVVPASTCLLLAGLGWALTHQRLDTGWNVNEIPIANGLYSLGAVLLLLRIQPTFAWVARVPWLDKLVSVMNARALTIYLWGNVAIASATTLEQRYVVGRWYDSADESLARGAQWVITWTVLAFIVLLLGWVEDVAARRKVRISPWPRRARSQPVDPSAPPPQGDRLGSCIAAAGGPSRPALTAPSR
jgi:peptidoglycan/LPS O-acetylase OafA/YrhL